MKNFLSITFLLLSHYFLAAQTQVGIEGSLFNNTLSNISATASEDYGYANQDYNVKNRLGFTLGSILKTNLHPHFDLEYGLGYSYENSKIIFQFAGTNGQNPTTRDLNIDLHYLQVPIRLYWTFLKKEEGQHFFCSVGLNTKFLAYKQDNYNSIITEFILLDGDFYEPLVLDGQFSVGFNKKIWNEKRIELELFATRNLTAFAKEGGWGFYEKLHSARNNQLGGIRVKYFMTSPSND